MNLFLHLRTQHIPVVRVTQWYSNVIFFQKMALLKVHDLYSNKIYTQSTIAQLEFRITRDLKLMGSENYFHP